MVTERTEVRIASHPSTKQRGNSNTNILFGLQTVHTDVAPAHPEETMTGIEEVQEDTTTIEATAVDTTTTIAEDVTEIAETTETETEEIETMIDGIVEVMTVTETIEETTDETETTEMTAGATDEEAADTAETGIETETMTVVVELIEASKYSALVMQTDPLLRKEQFQSPRESVYAPDGISKLLDLRTSLLCKRR